MQYEASAHPEKRLFIRLLTRDISLVDAFLDMMDNSINAALNRENFDITDAATYGDLLSSGRQSRFRIDVNYDSQKISVDDNCGGISIDSAKNDIFIFGAAEEGDHVNDSLSVYGIGLKRALFKFGNDIRIRSEHPEGGFKLNLDAQAWEKKTQDRWSFPINAIEPNNDGSTRILVKELHKDVIERVESSTFATELFSRVSRTYSFFLNRIVDIYVNGERVSPDEPLIGDNMASDVFEIEDVSVFIVAGIGIPKTGKRYLAERAGWNIFCNGRSVLSSEKSPLTGWGLSGYLPTFQPKHRPFVGMVFFAARDPASLPWTTTKLGVNPDNHVWQRTLKRMAETGRQITKFLDERYTEDGTSISTDELADAVGKAKQIDFGTRSETVFKAPKKARSKNTSVQFTVDRDLLKRVKVAIGKPSMSNGDTGRYAFDYFVENEMDE